MIGGGVVTALYGVCLMFPGPAIKANEPIKVGGAFNLKLALIVTLAMTGITFVSSVMLSHFGQVGVMLTAMVSGFADAHTSTASIATLAKSGQMPFDAIVGPVLIAISSNSISKCVVAWVGGSRLLWSRAGYY